jgi:hypothetical protein
MRMLHAFAAIAVLAIGCGDNTRRDTSPTTPTTVSSVGGAQIARSKSFVLVTNVSPFHASPSNSKTYSLKPALGGE